MNDQAMNPNSSERQKTVTHTTNRPADRGGGMEITAGRIKSSAKNSRMLIESEITKERKSREEGQKRSREEAANYPKDAEVAIPADEENEEEDEEEDYGRGEEAFGGNRRRFKRWRARSTFPAEGEGTDDTRWRNYRKRRHKRVSPCFNPI